MLIVGNVGVSTCVRQVVLARLQTIENSQEYSEIREILTISSASLLYSDVENESVGGSQVLVMMRNSPSRLRLTGDLLAGYVSQFQSPCAK